MARFSGIPVESASRFGGIPVKEFQTEQTPKSRERSFADMAKRQLGLTGRYVTEGLSGVGQIFSEPLRVAIDAIPGINMPYSPPSGFADQIGLPAPETTTENIVGEASRLLTSGGPFLKGASLAAQSPRLLASAAGKTMAANPLAQALSASSAGAASGATREAGGGQGAQLAASLLGSAAPWAVGRTMLPSAKNAALELMKKEGVNPTIGQAMGGRAAALEEKLQSVPLLGDSISKTKTGILQQYNKAAINRAVSPINKKVDKVGHEGVKQAGDMLSEAFDTAIKKIKFVKINKHLGKAMEEIESSVVALEDRFANQFHKLVESKFSGAVENGRISGKKFTAILSDLKKEAARFGGKESSAARDYAATVKQLEQTLMDQATKNANPTAKKALKAAQTGWANLVRVEQAAKSAINNDGVFTPGQLNSAVRMMDKSVRRRAVSRGNALMQDLGTAGQNVIGNKVPNSFTTDRMLYGMGALGSGYLNPMIPAGLAVGAGAYTPPVQNALVKALMARPEYAQTLTNAATKAAPYPIIQQGQR